ncbi:MAG: hypothetical protein ACXVA2_20340, partial [Mucilaginibacter sp.]
LIGGLSPKVGWKSLELLAEKVLPLMGHGKKGTRRATAKSKPSATSTKKKKPVKKAKAATKKPKAKKQYWGWPPA